MKEGKEEGEEEGEEGEPRQKQRPTAHPTRELSFSRARGPRGTTPKEFSRKSKAHQLSPFCKVPQDPTTRKK